MEGRTRGRTIMDAKVTSVANVMGQISELTWGVHLRVPNRNVNVQVKGDMIGGSTRNRQG